MKKKKQIVPGIMILLISLIYMFPFYMLILMSLKHETDYSSKLLPPAYFSLENYIKAWDMLDIVNSFKNNLIITLGTVIIVVVFGSMASYPLSRFRTKLNNLIYGFIVSLLVVPALTISVSLYQIMIDIHAIDTYWGMILVLSTFQLPVVVFLYTGFVTSVPRELDDAARIDGCTYFGVFFRIILPLLKSTTVTVVIITSVSAWNDYGNALFYLQSVEKRTMVLAISGFFTEYRQDLGSVAAGCIITVMPLIIVYLFGQKYFLKGMTEGAVK